MKKAYWCVKSAFFTKQTVHRLTLYIQMYINKLKKIIEPGLMQSVMGVTVIDVRVSVLPKFMYV